VGNLNMCIATPYGNRQLVRAPSILSSARSFSRDVTRMILLLLAAAPWTWSAELGGQIDSDPHGVVNASLTKDELALELWTDTLALWWRPELESGRAFLGGRIQGYAAEMFISPWTRGAEDPSRAFIVLQAALHAGWIEYLGAGFYTGVRGSARGYLFRKRSDRTTADVPGPELVLTPELLLGWWSPIAHAELSGGADVRDGFVSSRARLELTIEPKDWTIGPLVRVVAGLGHLQDDLTKTRVGGLNPHVVPLAGAAWAEWWVEDFAALRAGPKVRWSWGEVAAVADVAVFDDETHGARFEDRRALGFALLSRFYFFGFFLDAAVGYAPFIERQPGALRISSWILIGTQPRDF
jgi:hypothetical protein